MHATIPGKRSKRTALAGAAIALATIVSAAPAAADERAECAASAEQAQQLRDEGKYRRAREQMLSCARDVCPGPIKADCGRWLSEVDRDAPTVVFGARDTRGNDVFDVRVSMDGAPILDRLDGKPVLVDSGEHTFKFESKDGLVKEERVLLRAAEKARPIIATLGTGAPAGEPRAPAAGDRAPAKEGSIVPAVVVGAIGIAALGSFAAFGILGKGEVDDLEKNCKPNCTVDAVDDARTKLIIADVSLGVGVVALVAATVLYFTRARGPDVKVQTGTAPRQRAGLTFGSPIAGPVPGGAVAGFGAKF